MVRLSGFGDRVASRLRDSANLLDLGTYAGNVDCSPDVRDVSSFVGVAIEDR
jgi:hypothetical protein